MKRTKSPGPDTDNPGLLTPLSRRKFLTVVAGGSAALALSACATQVPTAAPAPAATTAPAAATAVPTVISRQTTPIKFGYVNQPTSPLGRAYVEWARLVSERTNGDFTLELFPGGQLGGDLEVYEQVRLGAPMLAPGTDNWLADKMPDFGIFAMPYVFPTWESTAKVFESGWYKDLTAQAYEKTGWAFFNRNWRVGYRQFANSKRPLVTPADMAGLKFRTPQSDIWTSMVTALGGTPVPLPLVEQYTALQQGLVDGCEGPIFSLRENKVHEVAKNLSMTNHILTVGGLFAGKYFYTLPQDIQDIIVKANSDAAEFNNGILDEINAADTKTMQDDGVVFTDVDLAVWAKAVEPVYAQFSSKWSPNLMATIKGLTG
jgi:TRAP-type transport system periplasmic protein